MAFAIMKDLMGKFFGGNNIRHQYNKCFYFLSFDRMRAAEEQRKAMKEKRDNEYFAAER